MRILIVDDEDSIRSLLKSALSAYGCQVSEADCGERALALATENEPFDLVVSDVMMPGMDGVDLVCELHRRGRAFAFLLISGFSNVENLDERIGEIQPCVFLPKPFTIPQLLRVIAGILPLDAHGASVRAQRERRALRAPRAPTDRIIALRRLSARLRHDRDTALAKVAHACWRSRQLESVIRRHYQQSCDASDQLERQRAMVESCSSFFCDR